MKTYRQFLEFVIKNYGGFIFAVIFYSLWLVYKLAVAFNPELNSFPGRMIGEATLNAYDINKRISIFYRSGLLFAFSITFLSFIVWRIFMYSERIFRSAEFKILNYSSVAGITFYFYSLWTPSFGPSYELIYCIHKIVIAGFFLKMLLMRDPIQELIDVSFYTISFVLSISCFFLLNEFSVLFGFYPKTDLLIVVFITVVVLLTLTILFIKNSSVPDSQRKINQLTFLILPLTFIPLLSFFKDEVYLILNRHEYYYLSPRKLYLIFLLFLILFTFFRYRRIVKRVVSIKRSNHQLVAYNYLPMLVAGLVTYTFYSPFIDSSNEMFEAGNRFLPLMEFRDFGVVPIFEKFNSHVLSELFFGSIYAFFNGLHSREMYIYEFMYQVFWAMMVYAFMLRLSGSAYVALFIVFLFPFTDILLTDYIIIAVLALFVTDKVIREVPSFKNYLLLFSCLSFLLLWRIDIGYPAILSSIAVIVMYAFAREQFKINWALLFRAAFFLLALVLLVITGIGLIRGINVFEKLWSGLNYLASAQTYGLVSFGDTGSSLYKMQYFVFPVIVIFGLLSILLFFKRFNISKQQRFIFAAFVFLAVYYIVNFQRGLVRHSFVEGHDFAVSSFLFFILSASAFLFCRKKPVVTRLLLFVIISTILMMNYKYPVLTEYKNLYSKTASKIESFSAIEPKEKIVRCIDTSNFEEKHFGEFKNVVSRYLNKEQTFIDFSNLPMLYYFTGKISPSYFYQNPLTIHNEYLQKKFIEELSNYDAPLIVFSNFPENWWDNVDGVPNTMRHYRLAEYFYQNYKPFIIANNLCIWKRAEFKADNHSEVMYSYYQRKDSLEKNASINFKTKAEGVYLIKINYGSHLPDVRLDGVKSEKPTLNNDIEHLAYYVCKDSVSRRTLSIQKDHELNSVVITKYEFMPDMYSDFPQKDDLKQLPFIWASYDDSVEDKKVLVDLSHNPMKLLENNIAYFNFNNNFDKTSGNGVLITLEAENMKEETLDLLYGGSKSGYKGAFAFRIPPGKGERSFYVRISSQYNWYDPLVDYIGLVAKTSVKVTVKKVELLKGE